MEAREHEAAPGTLSVRLSRDHRRLDGAVARVGQWLRQERLGDARAALHGCSVAWERQIRLEEELLYPLFELRLGTVGAGTAVMRDEHRELRRDFASLDEALRRGRNAAAREALEALVVGLASHFSREERVVYPTLDAMLSDAERGRLLARIEASALEPPAGRSPAP